MDSLPAKQHSRGSWVGSGPWLMVLVIILFTGFIRVRLLEMPLERDEGEYAYAGQLILQGIPPYELAYNMKFPGTYYAYALGMAVFGQTGAGVHLTLLLVNALTIVFVFLLARKLFGVMAGVVAAASYAVMAVSPAVLGLAAHANHFVVLFAVGATWLLLQAGKDSRPLILFSSGLLYGLALLMKQQGACFGLFGGLFLVWRAVQDKSLFTPAFLKRGMVFASGIILPLSVFCLACAIAGDFARFVFWTFAYAHDYATVKPWATGWSNLIMHLQQTWSLSLGAWLLAAAALLLARNPPARQPLLFVLFFWACSFLGTAVGLYFRSHYFILMLPAFAILIGAAVGGRKWFCQGGLGAFFPLAGFAAVLGWMIFSQSAYFFQSSPEGACQARYPENPFVEARLAADYIREHSAPDARIAVLGSEPEIYFYARRHSATGYIYTYPLMEPQRAAPAMQREMIQEIETARPQFIALVTYKMSWLAEDYSDQTIIQWTGRYVPACYDKVGAVGRNEDGEVASAWSGGTNGATLVGAQIEIYRRKPE